MPKFDDLDSKELDTIIETHLAATPFQQHDVHEESVVTYKIKLLQGNGDPNSLLRRLIRLGLADTVSRLLEFIYDNEGSKQLVAALPNHSVEDITLLIYSNPICLEEMGSFSTYRFAPILRKASLRQEQFALRAQAEQQPRLLLGFSPPLLTRTADSDSRNLHEIISQHILDWDGKDHLDKTLSRAVEQYVAKTCYFDEDRSRLNLEKFKAIVHGNGDADSPLRRVIRLGLHDTFVSMLHRKDIYTLVDAPVAANHSFTEIQQLICNSTLSFRCNLASRFAAASRGPDNPIHDTDSEVQQVHTLINQHNAAKKQHGEEQELIAAINRCLLGYNAVQINEILQGKGSINSPIRRVAMIGLANVFGWMAQVGHGSGQFSKAYCTTHHSLTEMFDLMRITSIGDQLIDQISFQSELWVKAFGNLVTQERIEEESNKLKSNSRATSKPGI